MYTPLHENQKTLSPLWYLSHRVGGWNVESLQRRKHQTQFTGSSLPCVPTAKLSYVFNLTFSRFKRWICRVDHPMGHHTRNYYYSSEMGYIYSMRWTTHLCIHEFAPHILKFDTSLQLSWPEDVEVAVMDDEECVKSINLPKTRKSNIAWNQRIYESAN